MAPASTDVTLDGARGSVTVSVTNLGPDVARIVLVAFDSSAPAGVRGAAGRRGESQPRATVEQPLRELAPGAAEQYVVTVDAAGVPAGSYELKVVAYPADRAPEEYADEGRTIRLVVPAETPAPAGRTAPRWVWVVAGVVLVVVIGVVAVLLLRPDSTNPGTVVVPDVAGSTEEQAASALRAAGLTGSLTTQRVDEPRTPEGVVVDTDPAAGESVDPETAIDLAVASGNVDVPALIGEEAAAAVDRLDSLGLAIVLDGDPGGVVVDQDRVGPTPVAATVTLTLEDPTVEDPQGPDLVLFTVPECSVVPGGALGGGDALTMFVAVRNAGPGAVGRLVPFELVSDTGLTGSGNTAVATGSATTPMQVTVGPADYGTTHTFAITADPANEIVERDESNNSLRLAVDLVARPSGAADVPCRVL